MLVDTEINITFAVAQLYEIRSLTKHAGHDVSVRVLENGKAGNDCQLGALSVQINRRIVRRFLSVVGAYHVIHVVRSGMCVKIYKQCGKTVDRPIGGLLRHGVKIKAVLALYNSRRSHFRISLRVLLVHCRSSVAVDYKEGHAVQSAVVAYVKILGVIRVLFFKRENGSRRALLFKNSEHPYASRRRNHPYQAAAHKGAFNLVAADKGISVFDKNRV